MYYFLDYGKLKVADFQPKGRKIIKVEKVEHECLDKDQKMFKITPMQNPSEYFFKIFTKVTKSDFQLFIKSCLNIINIS